MQAAATALPMPQTPSVTILWIRNNLVSAAIGIAIGVAMLGVDKVLGIGTPNAVAGAVTISAIATAAGLIASFAVFALLSGAALAHKLPAFPMRAWTALHVALGVAIGILVGSSIYFSDPTAAVAKAPVLPDDKLLIAIAAAAILAFTTGFGAILGGIQVLVLRKAATQVGAWIWYTAVAMAAAVVMFGVAMAFGLVNLGESTGNLIAIEVMIFAASIVATLVMLPAVKKLTPRGRL